MRRRPRAAPGLRQRAGGRAAPRARRRPRGPRRRRPAPRRWRSVPRPSGHRRGRSSRASPSSPAGSARARCCARTPGSRRRRGRRIGPSIPVPARRAARAVCGGSVIGLAPVLQRPASRKRRGVVAAVVARERHLAGGGHLACRTSCRILPGSASWTGSTRSAWWAAGSPEPPARLAAPPTSFAWRSPGRHARTTVLNHGTPAYGYRPCGVRELSMATSAALRSSQSLNSGVRARHPSRRSQLARVSVPARPLRGGVEVGGSTRAAPGRSRRRWPRRW